MLCAAKDTTMVRYCPILLLSDIAIVRYRCCPILLLYDIAIVRYRYCTMSLLSFSLLKLTLPVCMYVCNRQTGALTCSAWSRRTKSAEISWMLSAAPTRGGTPRRGGPRGSKAGRGWPRPSRGFQSRRSRSRTSERKSRLR